MKKILIGVALAATSIVAAAQTVLICTPIAASHSDTKVEHRQMKKIPIMLSADTIVTQQEKFTKVPGSARGAASYGIDGGGETQSYANLSNGDRLVVILGNSNFVTAGMVYVGSNKLNVMFDCRHP